MHSEHTVIRMRSDWPDHIWKWSSSHNLHIENRKDPWIQMVYSTGRTDALLSLKEQYFVCLLKFYGHTHIVDCSFEVSVSPCLSTLALPMGMVKSLECDSSDISKGTPYISSFSRNTTAAHTQGSVRTVTQIQTVIHFYTR